MTAYLWISMHVLHDYVKQYVKEKGRDPTKSYNKITHTTKKLLKVKIQQKDATKDECRKITKRLRTISWNNRCDPSVVVNPVYWIQTVPLTAN